LAAGRLGVGFAGGKLPVAGFAAMGSEDIGFITVGHQH